MTNGEVQLKAAIGKADLCELLGALFSFPKDDRLARGLSEGTVLADLEGCLRDIGATDEQVAATGMELRPFVGNDAEALHEGLKNGSSVLFFTPGGFPPVWPYEGPFRYAKDHPDKLPSLFRSPVTLDVEKMMKVSGVAMLDRRKEPCDSIWDECSYLSYLFGKQAEALYAGNAEDAQVWQGFAEAFIKAHFAGWVPDFMNKIIDEATGGAHSYGAEYASLARVGLVCTQMISEMGE